MIYGESITVRTPVMGAKDRFGNRTVTYTEQTVNDVLIAPGATQDMEAARPQGVTVALTLYFPKTFTDSLRGCIVQLPVPWNRTDYRVIGDPQPYMDVNTPTRWNRQVEVERGDG